ncbi:MAG: ATP synthase F1 subunit delta [Gammaproteobacteria bacterium RIFCSPHIGHO2_12_FULL_37_34]|nr:MAG: ATP synthase F1 subunit delta [Gammaproteobacteria bacterium RIFCSPHIGHO2_12_FULL_37_34]
MANLAYIARPYALAAFEYARDKQQLSAWKAFLEAASYAAKQAPIEKWLVDPQVSSEKLLVLFNEVLASLLNNEQKNFLILLAQNKRLMILSDISTLFNAHIAALEKMSNVRLITAVAPQETFQQQLATTLGKRIQHKVTLHCEVDPTILGGAVIHMGDRVIDGSVRGKLTRLLQNLIG